LSSSAGGAARPGCPQPDFEPDALIGTIRSDETRARFAQDWDNPRVIEKPHAVAPVVVIVLLGAVAAFATGAAGGAYFGTSPAVVASLGVGAIATAAIGHATTRN